MPNRTKQFKLNRQKIGFVVFTLAWAVLSLAASQFIIALPMVWILGDGFSEPIWTFIYYLLTYSLTLALTILLPPKVYTLYQSRHQKPQQTSEKNPFATDSTELGLQKYPTFVDLGLAPIGYVAYTILANLCISLMSLLPWFNADQAQDVGFTYLATGIDRVLASLAIVIIAPIAEEVVMRGWLYGKLRSQLKAPLAILLVSLAFALLHGQWNVGASVFVLSLVLCSLREITGTIWSGIFLHVLSNGIAFYLLYIAGI